MEVPIASETDEVESEETSNDTEAFSERQKAIRNSEVYKKFVADYNNSLETSKELLDNLVLHNADFNPEAALASVQKVLTNCGNSNQVFDIMHNMEQ